MRKHSRNISSKSGGCFMRMALLCAASALLFFSPRGAEATFISVDLGGEFVKVAGPKGQAIDILLNEQSSRKSPQFVGFRKGERFFSDDAKNLAARFPDLMVAAVSKYVGTAADDANWLEGICKNGFGFVTPVVAMVPADHDISNLTESTNNGTALTGFRFADAEVNTSQVFSAEELLGMFFSYIKGFSETELESPIRDAVVVVPAALGPRPRQAIIDAAALAGIRVFGLLNGNTAAALTLGLQNRGFDKKTPVVILDVGSTHAEASLFAFHPPVAVPSGGGKKAGQSGSGALGSIWTLAVSSNLALGGRSFDQCIAQLLENEFIDKNGGQGKAGHLRVLGGETPAKRRSAFSLMRAANKAKEVLSANQDLPITVENISPDRDFTTRLTRARFEESCSSLFAQVVSLVDQLFVGENAARHGVTLADVKRLELVGGGTRIPRLGEMLKARFGRTVDRTLNSDEAAASGAGYYGAALTGHFRFKGFAIHEQVPDNFTFSVLPAGGEVGSSDKADSNRSVQRMLFRAFNTSTPSRKVIAIANVTRELEFLLFRNGQLDSASLISGIASAYELVKSVIAPSSSSDGGEHEEGLAEAPSLFETRITVRLGESGLAYIEDATVAAEYFVHVTRLVPGPTPSPPAQPAEDDGAVSSDDEQVDEGSKSQKEEKHTPKSTKEQKKEPAKAQKSPPLVKKVARELRQRLFPLVLSTRFSPPSPMSRASASLSRERLRSLNAADDKRRELAAAKNDLESYLIWAKTDASKTLGDDEASQSLARRAAEVDAWLEVHSDTAIRDDYLEKLAELKALVRRFTKQQQRQQGEAGESGSQETPQEPAQHDSQEEEKKMADEKSPPSPSSQDEGDEGSHDERETAHPDETADGGDDANSAGAQEDSSSHGSEEDNGEL
jgi:molecular chaperone DnaK (HSP70)